MRRRLGRKRRALRVLHLPTNVASQASVSVRGLNAIGVEARGLVATTNEYVDDTSLEVYRGNSYLGRLRYRLAVVRAIWWADVIHWHYATVALPLALDLKLARLLGRPGVVEFWGSDIRIAEMEASDNPWFAARGDDYEYESFETRERSWMRQERFSRHGVRTCLITAPAVRFLRPGAFDRVVFTRTRVVIEDFSPRFPTPDGQSLVVVHSPSAPVAKGTKAVEEAVASLSERYPIDLRIVHGLPRQQNLAAVAECDVFLDQFVEGTTYGTASVEAMALGKPALCWIKPAALATFPADLPVVVTAQDEIEMTLEALLLDPARVSALGHASRAWVERHHESRHRARRLVEVYDELLSGRNKDVSRPMRPS